MNGTAVEREGIPQLAFIVSMCIVASAMLAMIAYIALVLIQRVCATQRARPCEHVPGVA